MAMSLGNGMFYESEQGLDEELFLSWVLSDL